MSVVSRYAKPPVERCAGCSECQASQSFKHKLPCMRASKKNTCPFLHFPELLGPKSSTPSGQKHAPETRLGKYVWHVAHPLCMAGEGGFPSPVSGVAAPALQFGSNYVSAPSCLTRSQMETLMLGAQRFDTRRIGQKLFRSLNKVSQKKTVRPLRYKLRGKHLPKEGHLTS